MTRFRMPAAGALLRARSERAAARRRYSAEDKRDASTANVSETPRKSLRTSARKSRTVAPTALDIAEARARMHAAAALQDEPVGDDLTVRAKRLYEGGVVPVRELAQLFGIAERTLYRYVARGGWRRRHEGMGVAAAAANRGRRGVSAHVVSQPRGAGGRFVRREAAGQPFARGLKALDPEGAARVAVASRRAVSRAKKAKASARRTRELEMGIAMLSEAVRVVRAERGGQRRARKPGRKPQADVWSAPAAAAAAASPARPVVMPPPAPLKTDADRRLNAIAERFEREARERPRGPRIRGL